MTRLLNEKDKQADTTAEQAVHLTDVDKKLSRAEGHREGVESLDKPNRREP